MAIVNEFCHDHVSASFSPQNNVEEASSKRAGMPEWILQNLLSLRATFHFNLNGASLESTSY